MTFKLLKFKMLCDFSGCSSNFPFTARTNFWNGKIDHLPTHSRDTHLPTHSRDGPIPNDNHDVYQAVHSHDCHRPAHGSVAHLIMYLLVATKVIGNKVFALH